MEPNSNKTWLLSIQNIIYKIWSEHGETQELCPTHWLPTRWEHTVSHHQDPGAPLEIKAVTMIISYSHITELCLAVLAKHRQNMHIPSLSFIFMWLHRNYGNWHQYYNLFPERSWKWPSKIFRISDWQKDILWWYQKSISLGLVFN